MRRVGPEGLGRHVLQDNDDFRQRLRDYASEKSLEYSSKGKIAPEEDSDAVTVCSLDMVSASRLREAQQRLAKTERQLAELRAENVKLRAQIMRGNEVAELIAMGGRFAPKGAQ